MGVSLRPVVELRVLMFMLQLSAALGRELQHIGDGPSCLQSCEGGVAPEPAGGNLPSVLHRAPFCWPHVLFLLLPGSWTWRQMQPEAYCTRGSSCLPLPRTLLTPMQPIVALDQR